MRLNNIARLIALLATDRRAWKQDCLYFVLCKIYLGLVLAAAAIASAKEDFSPDPQDQGVVWSIVDHGNRAEVLQFLAGQNNGNLQKIRTWQGEYHIKLQELLPDDFVATYLSTLFNQKPPSGLSRHSDFTIKFAIDMVSGSVFLSKRTQSTRFFLVDTPEEIELKTAPSVSDETSIITREHYIHISPKTEFADVGVISNFPEARNRRAAYREPTQRASAKRMGDLVDPRDFFAFNSHEETFGDKLAFYARVIKGEFGAEQQARSDSLKMYVAHLGDETLYRIVQELNGPDRRYVVSDWGSTVDFLPLRMAITADENGEEVVQEVRVDWKTIDGVYIPNQAIATGIVEGGKTGYRREANLITCEINSPLDPHQFDYQGLGLKDGELVIDEIENVVYVINGGALDKLTDFGAEYVPQESSGGIKGGSHQK